MKEVLSFEHWLILEKNKAVEYFKKNPKALSTFSSGIDVHKKPWDPIIDTKVESERKNKIYDQFIKKLSHLEDIDALIDPNSNNIWTILDILVGYTQSYERGKIKFSSNGYKWWHWKDFYETIKDSNNFDTFVSSIKKRQLAFPVGVYSVNKDLIEYDKLYSFIKTNFYFLKKSFSWLDTALKGITGSSTKSYENDLMKLGLSSRDVEVAMSYVQEWTSMSRKRIDPSVWPLLQKISVDPSMLPKYVYRGLFYDGAKIKDPIKWSNKWYPGSKPGVSQGKTTSWSVDRGTAISFMIDQDFIKDKENGYYMLLKWEVNPKMVIADLRNLPVDHKYWSQQEIIVSPDANNYEIDTMIPGKEGYEAYTKFASERQGGQGSSGRTKSEMAMNFIGLPFDKVSPGDRIEFKKIAKMTVKEFINTYPNISIDDKKLYGIGMPLWSYINKYFWHRNLNIISSSRNEVKFTLEYSMEDISSSYTIGPEIYSLYQKYKKEYNFNQFSGKNTIISNEGTINLISDDFYNIDIRVSWPTRFEIVEGGKEEFDKPQTADIESDNVLKKIFDENGGSEFFVKATKNNQIKKEASLSKNINIKIT